jgi:hypothetical protein
MRSSVIVFGVLVAAGLAACSSKDDDLKGYDPYVAGPGSQVGGPGGTTGSATTITNPATGQTQPVPTTGPASSTSKARQFFIDKVYPTLANCVACHAIGNLGAPKFLAQDAASSYAGLDGRGLIVTNSLFVSHGTHAGGAAPAMDQNQLTIATQWLAMEAEERVGQAAPVNILEKIGGCLDEALFNAIKFQDLRTTKRDNENADRCTGCDNAPCRTCHTAGDGSFYMAVGSALDQNTFTETKTSKYIVKYLGLNGTTPVASNAISLKAAATATDRAYSHPMFTIPTDMQTRLDAFVSNAITKYTAKQCGQ